MDKVRFTATKLNGLNKKGILKPDANGYYTMPIGGLNAWNSAGQYYTLQGAEQLFKSSSILMRRIGNGNLKSELGHPMPEKGMSENQYVNRVLTIKEDNVIAHIAEVWLDMEFGKKNPQLKNPELVAIMGRVKPSGPHAAALQSSFDNPEENVCFSIRGLTRDVFERGICKRVLTTIVTWDCVTEPGISFANKWDAPALEELSTKSFSSKALESILSDNSGIATENSKELAREALNSFKGSSLTTLPSIPLYTNW